MKNNIFKYLGEKKFTLIEKNLEQSLFKSNEICILADSKEQFFEIFKNKGIFYITSGRIKFISTNQVDELINQIKKL